MFYFIPKFASLALCSSIFATRSELRAYSFTRQRMYFSNCFRYLSFRLKNLAVNFQHFSSRPFHCCLYICEDQSIFLNTYLAYIVSGHRGHPVWRVFFHIHAMHARPRARRANKARSRFNASFGFFSRQRVL